MRGATVFPVIATVQQPTPNNTAYSPHVLNAPPAIYILIRHTGCPVPSSLVFPVPWGVTLHSWSLNLGGFLNKKVTPFQDEARDNPILAWSRNREDIY